MHVHVILGQFLFISVIDKYILCIYSIYISTVIWLKNIRIEVRTRERNHIGRPHGHAVGPGCDASIDLETLEVLESSGYAKSDLRKILEVIEDFKEELAAKWKEYHG
jgi:hypothetical protein